MTILGMNLIRSLALEDVEPAQPGPIDAPGGLVLGVLVSVGSSDPLIAPRAECPAAVLGRRSVAGEEDHAHIGRHPGVIEGGEQLVDGLGPEGIANLGPVEGDANGALIDRPVIGDVGERDAPRPLSSETRIEMLGNHGMNVNGRERRCEWRVKSDA